MKPKKFRKALLLNKRTISNLRMVEQNGVRGGRPPESEWPGEPCNFLDTIDPCYPPTNLHICPSLCEADSTC